ncbi:YeeE/YedE thiosulfate transporter family protein [Candidatus Accumulibacter sp. ACC003]|uniref:YeeE/YedE thiosulfate transporter family protein n=1 Tax=Candidatus Accumulibacter sp. ACC003 TaxID=2823334 RepID=UPI0025C27F18|nr:YeeE/YedE thiosulfate transporter family protein [Candidatus Accumulibacter sp. ACC003]
MTTETDNPHGGPKPYANPYLVGVLLGLVLLASFAILGAGLGASGGISRFGAALSMSVAPSHTLSSEYFGKWGENPLHYYLVFMFVGTFVGGLFSALLANRARIQVERGAAASVGRRLGYALAGGIIVGFASRLAQGCTSGQALTGGALLLSGSLVFLVCLFASGYAAAWFVKKQWHD